MQPSLTHPALKDRFLFRVSASAYFREIPCKSVANSYSSASFREIPCKSVASLLLILNSVANSLLSCSPVCLK